MDHPDLESEQQYFDALYARLDHEIETTEARLSDVRGRPVGGLHQARFEREAFAGHLEDRVATLRAHRRDDLCFGRIDLDDGSRLYIGRMGLADEHHEPLLVDWRAPAAAPFYQATGREPMGVVRRRHFLTRARTIVAVEDEVLEAGGLEPKEALGLRGEAALQYAMGAARTGRMREVAATLQREQDAIIRAPLTPAVLVQGGPGTGKTAVALHRAAYLLYTHRRQLSSADLLVIGPNPLFLRYIENVLPSLGETGVGLTAMPHVYAHRAWSTESEPARSIKARPEMVELIERAIATRQRPLRRPVEIEFDGVSVAVTPGDTKQIVAAAKRRSGRHNPSAAYVQDRLLHLLWRRGARQALGELIEYEDFRSDTRHHPRFRRLAMHVWPILSPERLLDDLFGFPALLRHAADGLFDDDECAALERAWQPDPGAVDWTDADAPLLDEASRQLGPVPPELLAPRPTDDAFADEEARAEAEYARQLLSGLGSGIVSRSMLEERHLGPAARRSEDGEPEFDEDGARTWRYAVIDEAQDISPMEWRMIGRHCPRRAVTVVGDLAQGTRPWSPRSWSGVQEALGTSERARLAELTVNYRTPREVSAYAAEILAAIDPSLTAPTAVRSVPGSFETEPVELDGVVARAAAAAFERHQELGDGLACVIAPESRLAALRSEIERRSGRPLPPSDDPELLDVPVAATTPELAKGLEFDVVVLAGTDEIVDESGRRGLYVSATRATRRLLVLHTGPSSVPV